MSHLVAPSSFRVGKTQPWANNSIAATKHKILGGDATATAGLSKVAAALLRRKRLYVVKSTAVAKFASRSHYQLLFAPRIKIRPREHSIGTFLRKSLLKSVELNTAGSKFKQYADLRKDKAARIRRRPKPKKLNRWLSKRMFRGADRGVLISRNASFNDQHGCSSIFSLTEVPTQARDALWDAMKISSSQQIYSRYYQRIHQRQKWKFDKVAIRRFNSGKFSDIVSRLLNRQVRLSCLNFFAYLVQKQQLNFKSHQNHFWNFRYRRYRFQYKNYYDILNSFLFMGLADNTEAFFYPYSKLLYRWYLKSENFLSSCR